MKINRISTQALTGVTRSAIARDQLRLAEIGTEATTGRHSDVGMTLGFALPRDLDARGRLAELESITVSNGIVSTRLSTTQSALSQISDLASGFLQTLMSLSQGNGDRGILESDARARLTALGDILSTSSDGAFVFGGTNISVPPLNDYLASDPSAGRTAVINSFTSAFGMPPDDPSVVSISGSQMRSYLSGAFDALFEGPGWQAFSNANDMTMVDRISIGETVGTSASANAEPVRNLVKALVAAIDSGGSKLSQDAFSELTKRLISLTGSVAGGVTSIQSFLGVSEERLAKANERMLLQKGYLEREIGDAENVDMANTSILLNEASSRLQASYAITSRLQSMSLLDYLPNK